MTITKHPLDWAKQKKTPEPMLKLGCAIAWHCRIALENSSQPLPEGLQIVDPHGIETEDMTEAQYDDMIAAASSKLREIKTAQQAGAKFVRVLPHPDGLHAVVIKLPGGMDARKYIAELRDIEQQDDPTGNLMLDAKVASFDARLLWPAPGTIEYSDLADMFALAHRMIYPMKLQQLAGWHGIDVKKKG
jgi:hypothetical protein